MKWYHRLFWFIVKYRRVTDDEREQMELWSRILYGGKECPSFWYSFPNLKGSQIYWHKYWLPHWGYRPTWLGDYYDLKKRWMKYLGVKKL